MGFHASRRAAEIVILGVAAVSIPSILAAQAIVRGVLYDDATGLPLQGNVMLVDPGSDATVAHMATDSLGNFSLEARNGLYQIVAVRPGYKSVLSAPVPLENGERLTIRVPIAENGDPVHRIGVIEHVRPGQSATKAEVGRRATAGSGFESRRTMGAGQQYDRARLEKTGFTTLGQFLQTVPGLMVSDPTSTASMQMSRNAALSGLRGPTGAACHVGWFMDGHRVDLPGRTDPLTDGLGSLQLETLEAVEVFRGLSEMPAEFAAPDLRCGAIAIWTRRW